MKFEVGNKESWHIMTYPVSREPCLYFSDLLVGWSEKIKHIPQMVVFNIWVFPKIGVSQNGWFIMENLRIFETLLDKSKYFVYFVVYIKPCLQRSHKRQCPTVLESVPATEKKKVHSRSVAWTMHQVALFRLLIPSRKLERSKVGNWGVSQSHAISSFGWNHGFEWSLIVTW